MRLLSAAAPLLLALALPVRASISVQSTITFVEDAEGVVFSGSLVNVGDQTAEDCSLLLESSRRESVPIAIGHLDPQATNTWTAILPHLESERMGSFAAVFRLRYTDPNGFPLHAVQLFPYSLGESVPPPVRLEVSAPVRPIEGTELEGAKPLLETAPLDGAADCAVRLHPRTGIDQRPATLRIVLPGSLAFADAEPDGDATSRTIPLAPPYPESVPFSVTNRSALAGSRISIGAILETTAEDGTPSASVATLQLPIGSTPPDLRLLTDEASLRRPLPASVPIAIALVFLLLEAFPRRRPAAAPRFRFLETIAAFAVVYAVLVYELRLDLVVSSGLCLGGDTPAHHYLFSHLRESLVHCRIVSWAPGWWCGFPMYRFYFPLPYLAMVLLDAVLPAAVAFKVGLVLGVFLTPLCTYAAARLLRLRRPAPELLVLATLPLLLDTTHTMWGVNLSSTLAGMISNSWSFAFFPLALASVVRDTLDARPRVRTVFLLLAVLLSHFFTSIVLALLLLASFPFLLRGLPAELRLRAFRAFALDGLCAVFLMLWWLLPLVADRPWSVDYGDPWTIHFFANLPVFAKIALGPVAAGSAWMLLRPAPGEDAQHLRLALLLALLQIAIALVLFFFGYDISKVFVNCRLWPFWIHGLLVASALVAAAALRCARHPRFGFLAFLLATLAFAWDPPNYARNYSKWNFEGIEARPDAPVFQDLVERLRGTPGRFAFDLHPDNVRFGSTRAFEALPALNGKPIVEGGIVNSAIGSLVAYSIQGEVSDSPAGWPLRVTPRRRDVPTGLRHLELLGVRHFLARSSFVQKGVEEDRAWTLVHDYGKWRLYENPSVDGSLVHAYPGGLPVVVTNDFQGAIIAWANEPALASTPQIVVESEVQSPKSEVQDPVGPDRRAGRLVRTVNGVNAMNPVGPDRRAGRDSESPRPEVRPPDRQPIPCPCELSFNSLRFTTDHIGEPHLIAVSAFPNWRILRGANRIYLATPGFMVVFPNDDEVELAFAPTPVDWLGRAFLLPGFLLLFFIAVQGRSKSTVYGSAQ